MDRNQTIGFILIAAIILVYTIFFTPEEPAVKSSKPLSSKTTEKVVNQPSPGPVAKDTLSDSLRNEKYKQQFGAFAKAAVGEDKEVILENEDIKVVFGTKGADIKSVFLKDYTSDNDFRQGKKEPLKLIDEQSSKITFLLPATQGAIALNDLYFTTQNQNTSVSAKDSGSVSFRIEIEPGKYLEKIYKLAGKGFVLKNEIVTNGLEGMVANKDIQFSWTNEVRKVERDLDQTRINTTVNYYTSEGEFRNLKESSVDPEAEAFSQPVKWVSFKQRFFVASVIASEGFNKGEVKSSVPNPNDSSVIKHLEANLTLSSDVLKDGKTELRYYFGPNNYQITKKVTDGFGNNVYLGWAIFSTINKFLVVPIFNFLQQYISNYGVIILILVLIIKLLLFPLSYRSHISMAKTKVLKPEMDEIKAKYPDDMQKQQAETMQLYSKVGVNPLSGCITMLPQIPIFLALYNFFPNAVELRQKGFLWAEDLSTYDAIISFTPIFGIGHVSLFCLLMTISTLIYTWFNNQVTTVTGPMKSMQYMMPLIFLFALNSFAAGLTYYYFVNNVLTIAQQLGFRGMVDEKKIRKKLDDYKTKNPNKKKSKFAQRLEDAMKQAEATKKKK